MSAVTYEVGVRSRIFSRCLYLLFPLFIRTCFLYKGPLSRTKMKLIASIFFFLFATIRRVAAQNVTLIEAIAETGEFSTLLGLLEESGFASLLPTLGPLSKPFIFLVVVHPSLVVDVVSILTLTFVIIGFRSYL